MELYNFVDEKCCQTAIEAKNKDEILHELARLACKSNTIQEISSEAIYNKLIAREQQGSTGIGNEIAIPHARIEGMQEFLIYIAVVPKGLHFEALDKKKVKIFFVLLGPADRVNDHLKILAAISRALATTQLKKELLAAPSAFALYESLLRNTRNVPQQKPQQRKMKLMIVILYFEEFLYDILEFLIEEEIEGATIIDSSGMGQYISNIPIFAEFIGFMKEKKNHSKTILAIIPEEKIEEVLCGIEEITGDLNKKQGAMVMTVDLSFHKGSMEMM